MPSFQGLSPYRNRTNFPFYIITTAFADEVIKEIQLSYM